MVPRIHALCQICVGSCITGGFRRPHSRCQACAGPDFEQDLWHLVRLTPARVRYTAWLQVATPPRRAAEGAVLDLGGNTGLDSACARRGDVSRVC